MLNRAISAKRSVGKKVLFLVVSASAANACVSTANAALILTIAQPGFAPVSVNDSATPGEVSFFGSYGTFTTAIEVGLSNINTPTASSAYLQMQSLDINNTALSGSDQLTVTLSESTPFSFPGTPISLMTLTSALGGTITPASSTDTVTFQSLVTPAGQSPVSTGTQQFTAATSNGAESVNIPTAGVNFVRNTSFSLENITTLSVAAGEAINLSGTSTVSQVPEPVTGMLLAGSALLGLSRRSRRRHA